MSTKPGVSGGENSQTPKIQSDARRLPKSQHFSTSFRRSCRGIEVILGDFQNHGFPALRSGGHARGTEVITGDCQNHGLSALRSDRFVRSISTELSSHQGSPKLLCHCISHSVTSTELVDCRQYGGARVCDTRVHNRYTTITGPRREYAIASNSQIHGVLVRDSHAEGIWERETGVPVQRGPSSGYAVASHNQIHGVLVCDQRARVMDLCQRVPSPVSAAARIARHQ